MLSAAPKARRLWLAWLSGILLLVLVGIVIARRCMAAGPGGVT
jgi:uncharacterized integral membrane protein